MKYLQYLFLLSAIILFFIGLYYWLWLDQIAYAALLVALASIGYSVYLHMTKSDRPA